MLANKDRVLETSTTTGTGAYTLAGAITGFQSFAAVGNLNTCHYAAWEVDANGNPSGGWETGLGTYTAAGTLLARTTVFASSNAGAAVSWAAGTRRISCSFNVHGDRIVSPGSTPILFSGDVLPGYAGIWIAQTAPDSTNYSFLGNNTVIAIGAPNSVLFNVNGVGGMVVVREGGVSRTIVGYNPTVASGDVNALLSVLAAGGTWKGLVVRAGPSQGANIFELQDPASAVMGFVSKDGFLTIGNATSYVRIEFGGYGGPIYLKSSAGPEIRLGSDNNGDFFAVYAGVAGFQVTTTANPITVKLGHSGTDWDGMLTSHSGNIILKPGQATRGIILRANTAPDSASLAAGDLAIWFDKTNGAAKVMFKAKTTDGTVVTGNIPLT